MLDEASGGEPLGRRDDPSPAAVIDFRGVVTRLFWLAVLLGGIAVVGATIHGWLRGLTFAVLAQWAALFGVAFVVLGTAVIAGDALLGARRARKRGQRLSSHDVGFTPRRPARGDD